MSAPNPGRKTQSAMEYLMTYGWAILAIAIVMVSLYSLGIFNTGSLQPTATPGSCEVVRTAAQTSLAGQCSNLIPKYVGQFSGTGSYVNVGNGTNLYPTGSVTITGWLKFTSADGYVFSNWWGSGWRGVNLGRYSSQDIQFWVGNSTAADDVDAGSAYADGKWHFIAGTYDQGNSKLAVYADGIAKQTKSTSIGVIAYTSSSCTYATFGTGCSGGHPLQGSLANVQVYNASLDNASIKALYQKGIGGAPIDLQHLVGWWPLNGNPDDYSGNNNQGTSTNVIWNANWQSGYTSPAT